MRHKLRRDLFGFEILLFDFSAEASEMLTNPLQTPALPRQHQYAIMA